jgi:hypothetical protein
MENRAAIAELCALAAAAAKEQGHELDGWVEQDDGSVTARRADCRRCGRVAYVRVENSLQGIAGTALTEACRR